MRVKVFPNVEPTNMETVIDTWAKKQEREIIKVSQVITQYGSGLSRCFYITTTIFYKEV